jgi:hypothetical protein
MNKVQVLLVAVLVLPLCSFGQSGRIITIKDSSELVTFVKDLEQSIEKRDTKKIRNASMDRINCSSCIKDRIPPPESYLVPVDTFINQTYRTFEQSRLWHCVRNEQPMINVLKLTGKGFEEKELKNKESVLIYELFYLTTKPNEIQLGQEGQQTGLQFIKMDNEFKLYGLATVP